MDASLQQLVAWSLVVAGFLSGALLGLRFHDDAFAGGYGSFRRRLLRLGHIACIALGLIALELQRTLAALGGAAPEWLAPAFLAGALAMPATCFLTAWRRPFRHAFPLPVALLMVPVITLLIALAAPSAGSGSSP